MKYINIILASKKTVFTYQDIENLLGIPNQDTIKSFFQRGVKEGIFINITKGIYGLKGYDIMELAVKLKKNSYISFETVLKKEGVIFQDYHGTIFLASDNTGEKRSGEYIFRFLKIKNSILQNPIGIVYKGGYMIASRERAICDRLYLSGDYFFDNLDGVDFDKLMEISEIYNKRVVLTIKNLIQHA